MILVRFQGGLGNQFFQYALGRHLSLIHQRPLRFDTTSYWADAPDPVLGIRMFGLSHFAVTGSAATEKERRPFALPLRRDIVGKIARSLAHKRGLLRSSYLQERESQFYRFHPEILSTPLPSAVCVDGFWQTAKYFDRIAETIREDLRPREPAAGENARMLAQIGAAQSVAIHLRHGDNANRVAPAHGVLPLEYYYEALARLTEKVRNPHCFIFSDDPAWAEANLRPEFPTSFVSHNGDERNYEDVRLMAGCKHHIVGNSTFSWWGAWLGKKPGQLVFAPKKYHVARMYEYRDYYPEDWILL